MNFRPELAAKVMAGEKTVTRRLIQPQPELPMVRRQMRLSGGTGDCDLPWPWEARHRPRDHHGHLTGATGDAVPPGGDG